MGSELPDFAKHLPNSSRRRLEQLWSSHFRGHDSDGQRADAANVLRSGRFTALKSFIQSDDAQQHASLGHILEDVFLITLLCGLPMTQAVSSMIQSLSNAWVMTSREPPPTITRTLYAPLDPLRKEIRLAFVWPSIDLEQPLSCSLIAVSLQETDIIYEAFSYCWGDTHDLVSISVNGWTLKISRNLESALREFRRQALAYPTLIWCDAVCINQQDPGEVSTQIEIMQDIYTEATAVRIWLGEGSPLAIEGLSILRKTLDNVEGLMNQSWDSEEQRWRELQALAALCGNPYWQRIWVIQEATLPKCVFLYIGFQRLYIFAWTVALAAMDALRAAHMAWISDSSNMAQGPSCTDIRKRRRESKCHLITIANAFDIMSFVEYHKRVPQSDHEHCRSVLYQLLLRLRHSRTTQPCDAIFGSLGLFQGILKFDMRVDRDLSLSQVFQKATWQILQIFGDLNILLQACHGNPKLPTWTMDFQRADYGKAEYLGAYHHYDLYNASNGSGPKVSLLGDCVLSVSSIKIDEIAVTGPCTSDWPTTFKGVTHAWIELLSLYAKLYPNVHLEEPLSDSFWRTSIWDQFLDETTFRRGTVADLQTVKDALQHHDTEGEEYKNRLARNLLNHVRLSKFFTTRHGYSGMLYEHAKTGDSVLILASANVPFVARPVPGKGNVYRLIGPCYVHGNMDGEAIGRESQRRFGTTDRGIEVFDKTYLE